MPKSVWYFAYGSNLSREQMLRLTGAEHESRRACLAEFRLAFRKVRGTDEVYADVLPCPGAVVQGVVYRCGVEVFDPLDRFEGVAEDHYTRTAVQVTTEDGEVLRAEIYLGSTAFADQEGRPTMRYLNVIVGGAREHELPEDYVRALENLAARSGA